MKRGAIAALAFAQCLAAGCAQPAQPVSDDDVLKHVLAIDDCNARVSALQADAQLAQLRRMASSPDRTPEPMATYDNHTLRLCFDETLVTQQLTDEIKRHPRLLALGRSCEKYVDTKDDQAMALYEKCIRDGMPAALKGSE